MPQALFASLQLCPPPLAASSTPASIRQARVRGGI